MLGVSLFNGYFKDATLYKMACWAMQNLPTFHFFVADTPTVHTFEAFGYTPEKARQKMQAQSRYVKNKLFRVLEAVRVKDPTQHIIDGAWLGENATFSKLHQHHTELYEHYGLFKDACLQTSQQYYQDSSHQYVKEQNATFDATIASKYIVWELPVICKTTEILNVDSSLFCYHKPMPILQQIFGLENELSLLTDEGNGFGLLKEV